MPCGATCLTVRVLPVKRLVTGGPSNASGRERELAEQPQSARKVQSPSVFSAEPSGSAEA